MYPGSVSHYCIHNGRGDRSTLFAETDNDSVLSGSACYSTELSEDDKLLSEAGSKVSLSFHMKDAIHPYLFEPEQFSCEQDPETLDTVDSWEEQIGNTNCTTMKVHCVLHQYRTCFYSCTCNFCHSMPTARDSISCQELDNIRNLLVGDPVPACITLHTDLNSVCLSQSCIVDYLTFAPTPLWN